MRFFIALLGPVLSAAVLLAQQGILPTHAIVGTVTDKQSHPLADVTVALTNVTEPDLSRLATTDAQGAYRFDDVLPGEYTVSFRGNLVLPSIRSIEVTGAGETRLDVKLPPAFPSFEYGGADAVPVAPKVVCGLTMIPGDPSVDPKMVTPRPSFAPPASGAPAPGQTTPVKPTMRTVQPGMCWDPAPAVTPGGPVRVR